jgi:hypothetical protein
MVSVTELASIPPRLRIVVLATAASLFACLVALVGYLAISGTSDRVLLAAISAAQFVGAGTAALALLLLSSRSLRSSSLRRETTYFLTSEIPHALVRCTSNVPKKLEDWSNQRTDTASFFQEFHIDHELETPTCTYLVRYERTYVLFRIVMNAKKLLVMYFLKNDALDPNDLKTRILEVTIQGATHAGWECHAARNADSISGETLVELYFYKTVADDFLFNNVERLYWSLDIAQMTRSFVLQISRTGITSNYDRIVKIIRQAEPSEP